MQQKQVSPGVRLVIGLLLGIGGLILTVAQVQFDLKAANPWQSTEMAGVLMGLCVMFCVFVCGVANVWAGPDQDRHHRRRRFARDG
jgi:hypothetical protein